VKAVEDVTITTGPHGGKAWVLKLDCGHVAVRSIPKFKFARRLRLAPHKAKCGVCEGR
jgi:hypothetical protein